MSSLPLSTKMQELRFCVQSKRELLGISIQFEHLYMVCRRWISIYEYHPTSKCGPQLTEELHLALPAESFDVGAHHICIVYHGLVEVRHRKHWENVIISEKWDV